MTSPRASARGVDPVPLDWSDEEEHRRMTAKSVNDLQVANAAARVYNVPTGGAAEIQAAIDAAKAEGAGIVQLGRTHDIASTIDLSGASNVTLRGYGSGGQAVAGYGTRLLWTGTTSTSNIVVKIDHTAKTDRPSIKGIQIDCDEKAGIGLKVHSVARGWFEDLAIFGYTNIGYDLGVNITEDTSNHSSHFRSLFADQVSAVDTAPIAMQLDGSSTSVANTHSNIFQGLIFIQRAGKGMELKNCDSNIFSHVRFSGAGSAITFYAGSAANKECRHNYLFWANLGASAVTAKAGTVDSHHNTLWVDKGNTSSSPTIESGASLHYLKSDGFTSIFGDEADFRLIGNTTTSFKMRDTASTTGEQAITWAIASQLLKLQTTDDDFSSPVEKLRLDLSTGEFTLFDVLNMSGGGSQIVLSARIDATAIAAANAILAANATTDTPTNSPETDAETGWIKVLIGGAARYIPFYT